MSSGKDWYLLWTFHLMRKPFEIIAKKVCSYEKQLNSSNFVVLKELWSIDEKGGQDYEEVEQESK